MLHKLETDTKAALPRAQGTDVRQIYAWLQGWWYRYGLRKRELGVRTEDRHWDVRAWCDNCFDEQYATAYFNAPFYFDDTLAQYEGQFLDLPRTYGMTLRMNF